MSTAPATAPAGAVLHHTDFRGAIGDNKRATWAFTLTLLWVTAIYGYVLGWSIAILADIWAMPPAKLAHLSVVWVLQDFASASRPGALAGAVIMLLLNGFSAIFAFAIGGNLLAIFGGARDADPRRPGEQRFINVVQEMAVAAGLPTPRVMVIDSPALNAFASGTSPDRAVITATIGLIKDCTREELQGVIGHEMGHIANYDVRYATVVAAMAGVILLASHFIRDMASSPDALEAVAEGEAGVGEGSDLRMRLLLTGVVLMIAVAAVLVAPLAARIVQFAISREREYAADATSVQFTRNPLGLIGALKRLAEADTAIVRQDSPITALCIASPCALTEGIFSTHPPIEDRIDRLQNLGG